MKNNMHLNMDNELSNTQFNNRRRLLKLSALAALNIAVPLPLMAQLCSPDFSLQRWKGYNKSIVIDGLSAAFDYGVKDLTQETLTLFKRSGITAINATIPSPGDDFNQANEKIDDTLRVINKYPDYLRLITNVADILAAKASNQIGVIIGFQSTEMFGNNLDHISYFAKRGARYMQLSYNGPSQYGSGGLVNKDTGLTDLGAKALKVMEKEKVLVDLSHSGQKTVAQAIKESSRPLTISHTGCNSIYRHPRNNDDNELIAVANKGGVVGIYLMPFLEGGTGEITATSFMRHLNHAINICGEDHVSIGSDQGVKPVDDGPEYREMIRKEVKRRIAAGISAPGETPDRPPFIPQLNSEKRMELIAYHMNKSGHSDRVIEKVLGKNLLNLYQEVW